MEPPCHPHPFLSVYPLSVSLLLSPLLSAFPASSLSKPLLLAPGQSHSQTITFAFFLSSLYPYLLLSLRTCSLCYGELPVYYITGKEALLFVLLVRQFH